MRVVIALLLTLIASQSHANPWFDANRRCKDKWPDDKAMETYCTNRLVEDYNRMPKTTFDINKLCDNKWGTDWSMKKYCIERQNEAKRNIEKQVNNQDTEKYCRAKWNYDYTMIEYCIRNGGGVTYDLDQSRGNITYDKAETSFSIDDLAALQAARAAVKVGLFVKAENNPSAVKCPNCSVVIGYDKTLAGKQTDCPRCRITHIFP